MSALTPDQVYQYHAALIQARAWFEHFKADVMAGVKPYPESLDTAIDEINSVLAPVKVERVEVVA